MKTMTRLLAIVLLGLSLSQCSSLQKAASNPNLVAALTPATTLVTTQYPQYTPALEQVTVALDDAVATGKVSPAQIILKLKPLKTSPEVTAVIQLVLVAYSPTYSPTADNLARLKAISEAIKAGLPPKPEPEPAKVEEPKVEPAKPESPETATATVFA